MKTKRTKQIKIPTQKESITESSTEPGILLRDYAALIRRIRRSFEDPATWPWDDEARISFCKEIYSDAKRISDSKRFVALKLQIAAADMELPNPDIPSVH